MRDVTRWTAHHNGEDALLHLAGILSAQDDHLHALEVDLDRGCRGHALGEAVGRELAGIVDYEIGLAEVGQFLLGRTNQHVVLMDKMSASVQTRMEGDRP